VATLVAYVPALRGKFVWDDDSWTTGVVHLLRDFAGLRAMWCDVTALQQYFPLTGTSFWLDYHLWGFWTLPYHVENVLLHTVAALLFWKLLARLQVPLPWLAAAIFALHPVMVESAGWITERKNVLSLPFYLGALLAYGRFCAWWRPDDLLTSVAEVSSRRWSAYALALLCCLFALLAKTTAFSLPPVLLLLCWWKRGRLEWRRDLLPTLPFFALAIGLGLVTSWVERHHVGSSGPEWALSFPQRCLIAGRALWFYVAKLFWPVNLCFVYPRWKLDVSSLAQWLFPVSAAAGLVALGLARRRLGRGPAAAAFFFVGTLFPLLGFINGYFMRYSFVCDHWTYLSSLSLLALSVACLAELSSLWKLPALPYIVAAVALPLLGVLTWQQSGMYRDMETLWTTTLARNPNAGMAHNNYGSLLLETGRSDQAALHFQKALELQPGSPDAHSNLGSALLQEGRLEEAVAQFRKAIELNPNAIQAHNNLGNALLQSGRLDQALAELQRTVELAPRMESAQYNLANALLQAGRARDAIVHFQLALELQPRQAEAHNNLANALLQEGRVDEAITHLRLALTLQPALANAHHNLGNALFQKGLLDEAVAEFQEALALQPGFAAAHNGLGTALLRKGEVAQAAAQFQQALELQPTLLQARLNLADVLVQQGKTSEAVLQFQKALAVEPRIAGAQNNLGNALLRLGRLDEAVAHLQEALRLNPTLAEAHNNLANALFQKGRAAEAVAQYEAAVAAHPDAPPLLNNLAWALATCPDDSVRNGTRAVDLARQADRLSGGKNPLVLGTLAAAYAEAGQFREAVATTQRAIDLAVASGISNQVAALRGRLTLFQANAPYRDLELGPRQNPPGLRN
jgi:tetratricopeptide (TPR) repeat protein